MHILRKGNIFNKFATSKKAHFLPISINHRLNRTKIPKSTRLKPPTALPSETGREMTEEGSKLEGESNKWKW
jgi:hypothetical protein